MDTPSRSSGGPQAQPRPPPPPPEPNAHQAPATDPQWRTACRTCGASFKSRNQLMRHLYRSHPGKPGKPGKPKAPSSQSAPRSVQTAQAPAPTPRKPGQPPQQVHPFSLLGQQQQLAFAAQVLSAIFTIGMQQQQQEGEGGDRQPAGPQLNPNHSLPPLPRTLGEASIFGPISSTVHPPSPHAPTTAAAAAAAQDQTWTHQGGGEADTRALDDSESEDSDDDDDGGGVALFGPAALGELPFRFGDDADGERKDVEGLGALGDLD